MINISHPLKTNYLVSILATVTTYCPAITADKQGSNNSGAAFAAIAAAIGNIIPNVPQLVPVE